MDGGREEGEGVTCGERRTGEWKERSDKMNGWAGEEERGNRGFVEVKGVGEGGEGRCTFHVLISCR
jgi:hypothetical protein